MKNIFYLFLAVFAVAACIDDKSVIVTVSNAIALDRENEMVEVSMEDVCLKLQLADTEQVVVLDEAGQQIPYQITYDGKIIFPASVRANAQVSYFIKVGSPEIVAVSACGKQYPERVNDVAWENDRIAFRTYGPALQVATEEAYGYDVWVKSVEEPVVETRYAGELNPEIKVQIDSLKKMKKDAQADSLYRLVSYHVDHGNGLDCYQAGPTLGGGVSALYVDSTIVYPYCYKTEEILDNGPLRFTVKLTYNPLMVKGDTNIVETRIISLDKGSQLNRTVVSYTNVKEVLPIVTGIVLHEPDGGTNVTDAAKGYIGYADPTDNINNNNGTIYVGAVFPANVKEAKPLFFSEEEVKERGAYGYVLAISEYQPDSEYIYYWGAGWSKYGFGGMEAWTKYLDQYARKVRTPLTVMVK